MKVTYTCEQVAATVNVSQATVRRHAKRWGGKKLPGSRKWVFTHSAVERLLDGGQEA